MKTKRSARVLFTLSAGLVLSLVTAISAQQVSIPSSTDSTTAKLVCQMISRFHISRHPIDDSVSRKLLHRYIEDLDPQKLYFFESDIAGMERFRTDLDDLLKTGDIRFGYDTFDLYLRRLNERTQLAHKLIDAEYDFTVDEEMVVDPDVLPWAKTTEELDERWRKRIKYELLSKKLDDTELAEAREQLHRRYNNIRTMMNQTEDFEKLESYLSSLTHCFDPHSSYLSPQSLEEFRIAMELSLEGIGAALRWEDGNTVVAEVIAGGAADADGRLQVGDKIVGVSQGDEEFVDIIEMKLSKVVRLIRGKSGTIVRLKIKKADSNETIVYALTRQKIELHNQEVRGEVIQSERTQGLRIGVINLPSFYRDFRGEQSGSDTFKSAARDLEIVLNRFRQEEVDGIVVDLRFNGGGALSEAIDVSGLFVDRGPIVQVKDEKGDVKGHEDEIPGVLFSGPMVVVTNRLSASASEIFAGAIKDYGRGIVVGDTSTHGKGTVQNVIPVGPQLFRFLDHTDRGALKLTIQQFYRVNGDSTQNRGVESDITLPSTLDHRDVGESFLDDAMAFDRVAPTEHQIDGLVSPQIIAALKQASRQRTAAEPEFQKLQKQIERFVERKNRKTVSLNEAVLKQEREDAGEADEELGEDDPEDRSKEKQKDKPLFPDGFYNNELLRITADYISLLKRGPVTVRK